MFSMNDLISFLVMILVGICFNPMNLLAYKFNHLYMSMTLFYGGLIMASNMIWAHEIVHYLSQGHFNINKFLFGVALTIGITILLLRNQLMVDDKQWLRRMIPHHSTALTTSTKIRDRTKNPNVKKLATEIIETQNREIDLMKRLLE